MADPGKSYTTARELLLLRRGVVFLSSPNSGAAGRDQPPQSSGDEHVRAVELELAELGYVLSTRLRARASAISLDELSTWRTWMLRRIEAALGADRPHEPLFRSFPEGIPADTTALWWQKVLAHYLQADGQPCLFCRRTGTTHVLDPCLHVVCDHCWDGASYSACPVCEHHVERSSPFFEPSEARVLGGQEKVTFKLIDLGGDLESEARALFVSICERKQALSPDDRDALVVLLKHFGARVLPWLGGLDGAPGLQPIPVRENVAIVFGTLFQLVSPVEVLPLARRYMTTATDVLRFLAVFSGADASLQKQSFYKHVHLDTPEGKPLPITSWWQTLAVRRGMKPWPGLPGRPQALTIEIHRFKMARIPRPLRRALLALLEAIPAERLTEDMLRHRSYWVWAGEFLHPSEYAKRYPNVAAAFAVVRKKAPDGKKAPRFRGFYSRMEAAAATKDAVALTALLAERPGELARRADMALRLAATDADRDRVLRTFTEKVPVFATPVLLTLRSLLPTRTARATRRLFWPKGQVANGVSTSDERPVLAPATVAAAVRPIDGELLARFARKPAFETVLIDEALRAIVVPFNERTASRSAVTLPRGSRVPVAEGKALRLFLHWCQPEKNGYETDLDLSVGFYDDAWNHTGVCSYYQLLMPGKDGIIAQSSGDMRDAPFPDGATEFVDVDRERALAAGIRWAVMVVNAYSGLAFGQLERAFAGLMLRDDLSAAHFDPRTVELKFALAGEHGIFMPLVLDVRESVLHWLDVYSEGQIAFNNVATSNAAITKICPEMIDYFASGVRPSMFDLGLYHAAARGRRVFVRAEGASPSDPVQLYVRRPGEDAAAFHHRLVRATSGNRSHAQPDEPRARPPRGDGPPLLALLHRGDVDLPEGSAAYALFRERVTPTLAASDLLS
jgi:hypothetical protein